MKIAALSDTHGFHDKIDIPPADILIFAGDISLHGTLDEILQFDFFLSQLDHTYKIVVAGNHDLLFQNEHQAAAASLKNGIYLQDKAIEIEGIKIYGSPWQPWFCDMAFNLPRGEEIKKKWDLIPCDTDILITHSPPFGIMDYVRKQNQGCEELLKTIHRVSPKYHFFGHIHEGYGRWATDQTIFANTSICNVHFQPVNKAHLCNLS